MFDREFSWTWCLTFARDKSHPIPRVPKLSNLSTKKTNTSNCAFGAKLKHCWEDVNYHCYVLVNWNTTRHTQWFDLKSKSEFIELRESVPNHGLTLIIASPGLTLDLSTQFKKHVKRLSSTDHSQLRPVAVWFVRRLPTDAKIAGEATRLICTQLSLNGKQNSIGHHTVFVYVILCFRHNANNGKESLGHYIYIYFLVNILNQEQQFTCCQNVKYLPWIPGENCMERNFLGSYAGIISSS